MPAAYRHLLGYWFALHAALAHGGGDEILKNPFHDPMLRITAGLEACPAPEGPLYTREAFRDLAHERSQRGVSCWLAGRCRLSNSYLYDAEIIPRVAIAVREAGGFERTSVWALGQRRRVWLRGCVRTSQQSASIEELVRRIDDVEDVQNEMIVIAKPEPARSGPRSSASEGATPVKP